MQLTGIHHVTAITSSAEKIYDFFTCVLGMRLVKKTVNQDDIHTYHLFFADDIGSPGTDITFFDFPGVPKGRHGTNEISRTSFRVPNNKALDYWLKRFERLEVEHFGIQELFGKKVLPFIDGDEQRYQLISDEYNEGVSSGIPWKKGPIPSAYAIRGLGPIFIRIQVYEPFRQMLEQILLFEKIDQEGNAHLFETGEGGNGAQIIVEEDRENPPANQGYGTVHHVAFRVKDQEQLTLWREHLNNFRIPNSGYVERYYFGSLYMHVAPHILFELATDGPGFMGDEPYETLGENLSLPPFLEPKRSQIEKSIRTIDTVRSTRNFDKEYEK